MAVGNPRELFTVRIAEETLSFLSFSFEYTLEGNNLRKTFLEMVTLCNILHNFRN